METHTGNRKNHWLFLSCSIVARQVLQDRWNRPLLKNKRAKCFAEVLDTTLMVTVNPGLLAWFFKGLCFVFLGGRVPMAKKHRVTGPQISGTSSVFPQEGDIESLEEVARPKWEKITCDINVDVCLYEIFEMMHTLQSHKTGVHVWVFEYWVCLLFVIVIVPYWTF